MSKMGDWVLDIEFDKVNLSRDEFIGKHGKMFAYVYDEQLGIIPKVRKVETRSYKNAKEIDASAKEIDASAEEVARKAEDYRPEPVSNSRDSVL